MATKKQKRERMEAKWAQEDAERRERDQMILRQTQELRRQERARAEKDRKDRAIAKSKRLAKAHEDEKDRQARAEEAAKASKPGLHRNADGLLSSKKIGNHNKRRKVQFNRSRQQEA